MIYQKDWLMRQIEQMVDAITHMLIQTATTATITETVQPELREEIEKHLRAGEICEAEDWLYLHRDVEDIQWLNLSVLFYARLNGFSDEYLKAHDFSREEIHEGLRESCSAFGLPMI